MEGAWGREAQVYADLEIILGKAGTDQQDRDGKSRGDQSGLVVGAESRRSNSDLERGPRTQR